MSELDFHVDYFIEVPNLEEEYRVEAEGRLFALTEGWNDFIGAAITIEEIAGVESPFIYQARIVAYIRPENIAVIAKRETPATALNEALSTMEDRIREERNRRMEVWKRVGWWITQTWLQQVSPWDEKFFSLKALLLVLSFDP